MSLAGADRRRLDGRLRVLRAARLAVRSGVLVRVPWRTSVDVVLVATTHTRLVLGVGGASAVPSAPRDGDPTNGGTAYGDYGEHQRKCARPHRVVPFAVRHERRCGPLDHSLILTGESKPSSAYAPKVAIARAYFQSDDARALGVRSAASLSSKVITLSRASSRRLRAR